MAIQNNIAAENSEYGIAFSNAYYRIVNLAITRNVGDDFKFQIMIDLFAYATTSPGDESREVSAKRYYANLSDIEAKSGNDFLSKCYAWFKDQPEFSGASDS